MTEESRSPDGRLQTVLPPRSRSRRLAEWGVVAWAAIGVVVVLWILYLLLHRLAGVVPYLVVAGLVAFVLGPAVRGLVRLRVPRPVAATAVFLAAVAALPAVVPLLLRTVLSQVRSLLHSSPASLHRGGLVSRLSHSSNSVLRSVGHAIRSWVTSHQHDGPKILASLGTGLARAGVVLLLGGFLGYLFVLARPGLASGFLLVVPPSRRATTSEVLGEMGRIVSGFVRARLLVSAVVGALATLGLWAIGMPSWLVLGIIVGLANLIPTLGSFIGAVPVILVSLLTRPPAFLFAAVAVMLVAHAVDGYILSPIVLKETTDLHPIVVLLTVVAGAEVLGLWGVFLAIPLAGMVQYGLKRWLAPRIYGRGEGPLPVSAEGAAPGGTSPPP
jgi:predicted PurR-regulated permease PerM